MLEIRNLSKMFNQQVALQGIQLKIEDGEFFSLLGPSGCGKTTLLRILAGFESHTEGQLLYDGQSIEHLPPYKREFNMVFQQYALFPHKDVFENIAFGLRMKKMPSSDIKKKVKEALELVKMEAFMSRSIDTLSGGQKQRVAIARAIVNRPKILLLDEPLSALDLKLREAMQVELLLLQRTLKTTFIFVTHDQQEALTLSDRICIMNKGKIEQIGTAQEIYEHPKTDFAADFIGTMNVLMVETKEIRSDGAALFYTPHAKRPLLVKPSNDENHILPLLQIGGAVKLMVRPEKLRILKSIPGPEQNALEATIKSVLYYGAMTKFILNLGKENSAYEWIVSQLNSAMMGKKTFLLGEKAWICWDPQDCFVIHSPSLTGVC